MWASFYVISSGGVIGYWADPSWNGRITGGTEGGMEGWRGQSRERLPIGKYRSRIRHRNRLISANVPLPVKSEGQPCLCLILPIGSMLWHMRWWKAGPNRNVACTQMVDWDGIMDHSNFTAQRFCRRLSVCPAKNPSGRRQGKMKEGAIIFILACVTTWGMRRSLVPQSSDWPTDLAGKLGLNLQFACHVHRLKIFHHNVCFQNLFFLLMLSPTRQQLT